MWNVGFYWETLCRCRAYTVYTHEASVLSLISISCHLGWDGVRGGLAEDCGAAVNRKRVKVSESSHTSIVMIFIT